MSEQKLDVYTYAKLRGAHFDVGINGVEWISRCVNPACDSKRDAFSVQPEGKRTGRWADRGAWMCRRCWDPAEMVPVQYGRERGMLRKRGWGTIADLVMAVEGMTYREAERFIQEYDGEVIPIASRPSLQTRKPDDVWFKETFEYLEKSQMVGQEERALVHSYLASRGLTIETAKRLGMGYSLDTVKLENGTFREIPFLVIPWYKDKATHTLYRKVNRRNLHSPLPGDEPKYKTRWQSDNNVLYLGEILLKYKRPTFLTESELCAATILQEAGDLVNVVATGTAKGSRNPVNAGRLRRQPFVFVTFDTDDAGEEASQHWVSELDKAKSTRYKPLMHDVNEMHTKGLSVRKWVEDGLVYFVPSSIEQPLPVPPAPVQVVDVEIVDAGQAPESLQQFASTISRMVDVLGGPEQVTLTKHVPTPQRYQPVSFAFPRSQCPHMVTVERWVAASPGIKAGYQIKKATCQGKVLAHGWCAEHAYAHTLLCLGAALGYPEKCFEYRTIGAGVVNWEAYAEGVSAETAQKDIEKIDHKGPVEYDPPVEQKTERPTTTLQPVVADPSVFDPAELAMVERLQAYGVQLSACPCARCGCRLIICFTAWECARCEPHGLWSDVTLKAVQALPTVWENARNG